VNVPSFTFLGFAAIAALLFNLCAGLRAGLAWRRAILLVTNLVFFASFSRDVLAYLPFILFLALGFGGLKLVAARRSRGAFLLAALPVIAAFFWLKRYSFIPDAAFLPFPYMAIGLSYVFFRVLHLVIDAHEGTLPDEVGLLSYVNYTLNFTALVSGPIQRYQDYHHMEAVDPPPLRLIDAGVALERIVIGFFKVIVVSVLLSAIQSRAIGLLSPAQPMADRLGTGLLIAAIYPVYLYFNFSGYTDFVIGVARFFRLQLPENFDRPFSSENFIAFWSRWHITLSMWLKTYVYTPLVLTLARRFDSARLEPYFGALAYFVTFFLVGVWHGRTSVFVVFGVLQGLGVAGNKLYQIAMANRLGRKRFRALGANALYRAFARGLTFTWFTFTMFWFWSDWHQMAGFVAAMGAVGTIAIWPILWVGATIMLAVLEALRHAALGARLRGHSLLNSRYVRTAWGTALVVIGISVTILLNAPAPDIVYKTF